MEFAETKLVPLGKSRLRGASGPVVKRANTGLDSGRTMEPLSFKSKRSVTFEILLSRKGVRSSHFARQKDLGNSPQPVPRVNRF